MQKPIHKNESAAPGGCEVPGLKHLNPQVDTAEPGTDFTLTIDFLTRRVRALIRRVGNRKPTKREQAEAQELRGRLASLNRENGKLLA